MKTSDFDFDLPQELVASSPSVVRGDDRLMQLCIANQQISHHRFSDIVELLPRNALLVFNDSKVRKARLMATAMESGASVEMLLLHPIVSNRWVVLVSKAKRQKEGKRYQLPDGVTATIISDAEGGDGTKIIEFFGLTESYIEKHGSMPLPPYMHRDASKLDDDRYQTIYAKHIGSAAAPTAGLHFTEEIVEKLTQKGIEHTFATLHVGMGTFAPVRAEIIEEHKIHTESYSISAETAHMINHAKAVGRPIIAVGTTTCRLLESAMKESQDGKIHSGSSMSSIFIYPGYEFRCIDGLITNFHTPKSTLLALVSALAGYDLIRQSYQEAIKECYRFFSYGDAMLILP
ncbi:tRNA preQ1(34) S-adenosylmethionine ribosyltransferase-isomerase QueA [Entomospira entomophila]|uniref:S-adenosylmethionine:tRNA ribosyltransferase-isomerase n=1 Tax=Entomospira entomophila TaxID=2719988 RepID=A0A968GAV8_9SPIO|nr:tRNA preQ1(34) S-adenosylmethionine ribosyltransferase-isomerase QueA [Entomospira entomophilus]NIZ41137.1 tRNA preQ1(34) S-adenosylmethionine ribosyltransferase-isomerase QueA [Entomospira entomophilus]WDI35344.1 tRNA preQ1(34) S-adenosylmethionine ribosyltransferase-isomerase QueA [Entomospira entomophilus]